MSTDTDIARQGAEHKALEKKVLSIEETMKTQLKELFAKLDELTKMMYGRPSWWVTFIISALASATIGLGVKLSTLW